MGRKHKRGDSFLFKLMFYLYWYSYIVYFVCDSASEFGATGSTSFLGFSLLFLGTCIIIFLPSVVTSFGSLLLVLIFIFLYLILG